MYGHMPGYAGYPMPASYGFVPARPEGLHPLGMVPPGSPRRSALYSSPGRGGFRGQGDRGRGARSRGASLGRYSARPGLPVEPADLLQAQEWTRLDTLSTGAQACNAYRRQSLPASSCQADAFPS